MSGDEHIHEWLGMQQTSMVADLIAMANQNSGSQNLPGLHQMADWLEDWMDLPATHCQRIALPARREINDRGEELAMESAPLLRWDWYPERSRRVLLAIHYDTVYSPQSDFQECEWLSEQRLRGPGVADAKGGIIVLRYALKALAEHSPLANCGCTVLLNPDEELGSPSSAAAFRDVAGEFDFGLLFEPALPTGDLVSERKGSGNFTIIVRGRSAHAGRDFASGRNAIIHLCQLLTQIDQLNGTREGLTVNVGMIHGGTALNVVPDLALGRVNMRVADPSTADWAIQRLDELVKLANKNADYRCQLHGAITSPPKVMNDRQRQLMLAVEQASLASGGLAVRWRSTGGVCDGNKLAAAGLANIDTLGPCGDGLHSSEEWVDVPSLVAKARLVVNLIKRFDSGEFAELSRQRLEVP